jgi:hypothetical protein
VKYVAEDRYVPPPAFAPPQLRVAPVNETTVLGHSTYPHPSCAAPPAAVWQPVARDRSTRRRTVTAVVSACVLVALTAIAAMVAGTAARPSHSLRLPALVGGYNRVTTLSGRQVETMFSTGAAPFAGIGSDDLTDALVGVYADSHDMEPSVLFVGFTADASPTIGAGLRAGPSGTVAEQVLEGAGATTAPQPVEAGPIGGAMRCATMEIAGSAAAVGVWADHDTLGIVVVDETVVSAHRAAMSAQRTGALTREFRAAAEH